MEIHVSQQAGVFLLTVAAGLVSGMVYDLFRIARRIFTTPDWVVFLCDVVFWIVCSVLSFGVVLRWNSGELRWFLFAGFIIGGGVYFPLLSGIVAKTTLFILKITVRVWLVVYKMLSFPVKIALRPLRSIKKSVAKKSRFLRKGCTGLGKKIKLQMRILKKVRKTS